MSAPQPQIWPGTHRDFEFMQQALALAAQGLGRVVPNPAVGCLIVRDGTVIGAARTADGGRPHAETQALAQAGDAAAGATAYVTLEPCGHTGRTPPCVEALIAAQVARVVIACRDPAQADHHCIERLEQAGIAVTLGVAQEQAEALNEGFFMTLAQGRPFVTAKIATSLDGMIASHTGHSQWITGPAARQAAHEYRARHDAIMVGVGTVLADNPRLTVRLDEYDGPQPLRIVIDHDLKVMPEHVVFQDKNALVICGHDAGQTRRQALADTGAAIVALDSAERRFDPAVLLRALADRGLTRVFIEGGGHTLGGFMRAGLIDRLLWFRAPKLIGGDGIPAFQGLGVETVDAARHFTLEERRTLGEDFLEIWRPSV